jgi:hypothetical protein
MSMEHLVEWELAGETEVLAETCPSATLSTRKSTWPDLGSNPGRRGGKPVTNRLSYDTATISPNLLMILSCNNLLLKQSITSTLCVTIMTTWWVVKTKKQYLYISLRSLKHLTDVLVFVRKQCHSLLCQLFNQTMFAKWRWSTGTLCLQRVKCLVWTT